MNLKIKKSYLVPVVIFALVLMSVIILGSDTAYAASGGETKLYKAAFSYKTYLCDNTTESLHSSGSGVTSCTADSSEYGTSDICFDIYGSSYKGEGTLNGGYLNSSSVHVIANTGWSTSSIKLVNQAGTVIKTGTVSLSAAVDDGEYRVIYEGTGQGWLVNQREYKHYKIVCEFSFGVDTVSPTVAGITTDLTYSNGSVTVGAEDGLSGISALYMKNPQSSSFAKVTAPYTVSKEDQNGKYTFYSEDMAGNRSQDYVVFLDTEKPKIKVKKNGYETSDIYVSRGISVSAADNGETDTVYISENGGEYKVFNGSLSENTELKFKATDKAGNVSDERTVYIDTEAPQGKILNGEGKELNGAFVSTQSGIKYMAEDTGSGLKKRMMKAPGSSSYREYNGFIQFDEGEYSFYSEDNAGNRSAEMTVTVDNTKPSVKAFAGENEMNGKYSSASYIKFYAEDTGGIESVNLTVDGIKTEYTPMAQLKEEGRYTFYAVDKAGNKSASVTVILDRTAPSGDIFAGGIYTDSGISNKESFFVSVYDTCSEVKSILVSKDKGEYVNYENQSVIYDEGYYSFIFRDNAGNESEILYYILDRTAPDVALYDDNGYEIDLYSSTNVQFSCQDNFGVGGTYIKSLSDLSYRNYMLGEELKDGHYYFYSEDMAGNVSDIKEAVIDTVKPTLSVYSGDTNVNGVNFVNNTIRVYGFDENTISIFVLLPGEKEYISYNEGNILSMEGTYSFKASDAASNVSDILTITIDKTGPDVSLYSENTLLSSGSFVNKPVYAEASDISGATLYVKIPGSSIYSLYIGEPLSGDGTYYFYAADGVMNSSSEKMVTVDTVIPKGTLFTEGNKSSSLYSNAAYITYESSDDLSGISKDYVLINGVKREYKGEILSLDGHYVFFSEDKSGNESIHYEIYLDRTKPLGLINSGGRERTNKPFSFSAEDETALSKVYIKRPGMDYAEYNSGEIVSDLTDGMYYFYAEDMAGNKSDSYSLIVDITCPIGFIAKNEQQYYSSYINAAFKYVSERDALLYMKGPEDCDFSPYDASLIDVSFLNGEYSFYAEDRAGNLSVITSVILDTVVPNQHIYSDGFEISTLFTNKNITYEAEDEYGIYKMYVIFNGDKGEYTGGEITKEGLYEFYSEDLAGNVSGIISVTIDKTKPVVRIFGQFDEELKDFVKSERIYMNAEDDNLSASYIKRPSKSSYEPYTLLSMYSEEGRYSFYSVDKAGNISDIKSVTIDRTEDFVSVDGLEDGIVSGSCRISFKNNGLSPVKKVTLNGIEISNGETVTVMDGGMYSATLEDEAGNKGTVTFTGYQELFAKTPVRDWYEAGGYSFRTLSSAAEYTDSAEDIRHCYYFEKAPAPLYEGENIFKDSYTLQGIRLISGLNYTVDGEKINGLLYQGEGRHFVTVSDQFGNSRNYSVTVVNSKEKIYLDNTPLSDSEYHLFSKGEISINSCDEDALLIVKNRLGEITEILSGNEKYTLKDPMVSITAVNRFGTSKSYVFYLSLNPGKITFEKSEDNKKLSVGFTPSEDKYVKSKSFRIYKLSDTGYTEILKDDYRKEIGISGYTYQFRTSGKYKVIYEDNFRSGDNAVCLEEEFVKAPPEINITDVSSYYISQDVYVSFDDEAYIILEKDGKEIPFVSGRIKDEGAYKLTYSDYDNHTKTYLFEIDKTAPDVILSGCSLNGVTNNNVEIIVNETDVKLSVVRNGKEINLEPGDVIDAPGVYEFTLEDRAGNVTAGAFEIDKEVDYTISTLNGGVSSEDVVISGREDVKINLKKDSLDYAVSSGERISEEGYYKGEIEDNAGNRDLLEFRILKSKVRSFSLDLKDTIHLVSAYKNQESFTSSAPFVFNEDGTYSITLSDGEKTASFVIIIDTTAPEIELDGVMNGGKTKKNVSVKSVSEECSKRAYLNGRPIAFSADTVFKDEGVYTLYFTDSAGNETDITFEIKKGPDPLVIFLIILMVLIIVIALVFFIKSKKKKGPDLAGLVTRENPEEDEEKKVIEEDTEPSLEQRENKEDDEEISIRNSILSRMEKEDDSDDDIRSERDLLYSKERRSMIETIYIRENSFAEDFSDGFLDKGLIKGGENNG